MDQAANEVYDFIFKVDRRIGYLEKDIVFIEKKITTLDFYKGKMYADLREELAAARISIDDIKSKLKNISIGINALSLDMKEVVKKEQSDALSRQVDELPLNEYLTKKELRDTI